MLILLSGPSAVGKNTIIEHIIKKYNNFTLMRSCTTRPKRESDDTIMVQYDYISVDEFLKKINNDEMFEYSEVHGNYYGIPKENLERAVSEDFIKDIDVLGAKKVVEGYGSKATILSIFLDAPDVVLKDRLINRGESPERIEVRMQRNNMEREYKANYDLQIMNTDLNNTLRIIFEKIEELKK